MTNTHAGSVKSITSAKRRKAQRVVCNSLEEANNVVGLHSLHQSLMKSVLTTRKLASTHAS